MSAEHTPPEPTTGEWPRPSFSTLTPTARLVAPVPWEPPLVDADDPAGYVDLVTGPMLEACAPHARWIDAFCERAGTTQARLVDLCEEAASGADPVADAMVDLFVASSDYRVFVSMCVERAKLNAPPSRQPEGKDDDGGKEDDYKRESK